MSDSTASPATPSNGNRPGDWWKHPRSQATFRVALVVILVGITAWWFFFRPYVSTDDARVAATLVRLSNEGVSGPLVAVYATEGTPVTVDMVLAELDHTQANAQLAKAEARRVLAERQNERLTRLVAAHAAPQQQLDAVSQEFRTAQADVDLARLAVQRTYLKSPLNGVVVQKTAEVGNMLETGQSAFAVADLDHAWVAANIEETKVGRVKEGQEVKISVDEGGELTGKVLEIRRAVAAQFALIPADNGSGNFTKQVQRVAIKVALDPYPGRVLRVGQSVVIRIRTK
jgi:membrane fusion protein (multidrug efflux system)